jgi:hypothetical protein
MLTSRPTICLIGGCNCAGKTTLAKEFLPHEVKFLPFTTRKKPPNFAVAVCRRSSGKAAKFTKSRPDLRFTIRQSSFPQFLFFCRARAGSPRAVDSTCWKVAKTQRRGCGPSVSVPAALTVLPLERTAASIFFSVVVKGS